jgi:hypothetical protein
MSGTRTNRGGSPTAVDAVGTETLDPYAAHQLTGLSLAYQIMALNVGATHRGACSMQWRLRRRPGGRWIPLDERSDSAGQ